MTPEVIDTLCKSALAAWTAWLAYKQKVQREALEKAQGELSKAEKDVNVAHDRIRDLLGLPKREPKTGEKPCKLS